MRDESPEEMLHRAIVAYNWTDADSWLPKITDPNRIFTCFDHLLDDPANPLLHYAISRSIHKGARTLVTGLLAMDAIDPDLPSPRHKWTGLHVAVNFRHPDLVKELLAHAKTDPNAASDIGHTAVHLAILPTDLCEDTLPKGLSVNILSILLDDDRINPNLQDWNGDAPLHIIARARSDIEKIRQAATLLIARGANPFHPNNEGKTPFQICEKGAKAGEHENFIEEIIRERRWCRLRQAALARRNMNPCL